MSEVTRKYRKDYQVPTHWFDTVDIFFNIQDDYTDVRAVSKVRRNEQAPADAPLHLDGRGMELVSLTVNGRPVAEQDYEIDELGLRLKDVPEAFELAVETRIQPDANLSLEGLYRSGDILCTQCESSGFSRITYFPDRPDVMSSYTTLIEADKQQYPVLLSNGNCIHKGDASKPGRHYAVFQDPYVKPCYLFALVAGDLGVIQDSYTTGSGREIDLRLYTEHGNEKQCEFGVESLKQAMAWDEKTYGLEYDLDSYVIVAVGSFNFGAMENKGLNIFNTSCVFAHPETATDADFMRVRDVIAHEYFHNYTGDRVTCRDWFQLSLKEGLTVFREHHFSLDHNSPGVTRVGQVRIIREAQFAEDASPQAHPVRPESYVQMDNFYTVTIYNKGAEVINMIAQMAGLDAFIKGVGHYLKKHDGQAVTIEDFVIAIEESTGLDLVQFRRWYEQAGTPQVSVDRQFDAKSGKLKLALSQHTPATPGQKNKKDLDIPLALALFDDEGTAVGRPQLIRLNKASQTVELEVDDNKEPTLSILRGFSAPVKVKLERSNEELAMLMAYDDDPVARWDAAQQLYLNALVADANARQNQQPEVPAPQVLIEAVKTLLNHPPQDQAQLAEMLTLPTVARISDEFSVIDVHAIVAARDALKKQLANTYKAELEELAEHSQATRAYEFTIAETGRRRLLATVLDWLASLGESAIAKRAKLLYENADNMTDCMAALSAMNDYTGETRSAMMNVFAKKWADEPLVMDKWLRLQVSSRGQDAIKVIHGLLKDKRFDWHNPNRLRALLVGFVRGNPLGFHRLDGLGYDLLGREIERIDQFNPQLAARLTTLLSSWKRYLPEGEAMRSELERLSHQSLSSNTMEIINASLGE